LGQTKERHLRGILSQKYSKREEETDDTLEKGETAGGEGGGRRLSTLRTPDADPRCLGLLSLKIAVKSLVVVETEAK